MKKDYVSPMAKAYQMEFESPMLDGTSGYTEPIEEE